jgi:hypothetical protein
MLDVLALIACKARLLPLSKQDGLQSFPYFHFAHAVLALLGQFSKAISRFDLFLEASDACLRNMILAWLV